MKCYLVSIEERKGDGRTLGPFLARDSAIQAVLDYANRYRSTPLGLDHEDEFGGKLAEGTYCTEEVNVEIYEREMRP